MIVTKFGKISGLVFAISIYRLISLFRFQNYFLLNNNKSPLNQLYPLPDEFISLPENPLH